MGEIMKWHMLLRMALCVFLVASPFPWRSVASDLGGEVEADSSRAESVQDLRWVLPTQFKEGDGARIETSGRILVGKISRITEQYLFLGPSDSVETRRIEKVWKRSDGPGEAVMTGALVGGMTGAARVAGGGAIPVGLGFVFGAMIGTAAGLVVAVFLPEWIQVFPVSRRSR